MRSRDLKVQFALTDWQAEAVQSLFDRVQSDASNWPRPGIIAQVFPDGVRVRYLTGKQAVAVARAMGRKKKAVRYSAFGRAGKPKSTAE